MSFSVNVLTHSHSQLLSLTSHKFGQRVKVQKTKTRNFLSKQYKHYYCNYKNTQKGWSIIQRLKKEYQNTITQLAHNQRLKTKPQKKKIETL